MKRAILSALAVLGLSACATPQDYSAANDIHAFLLAVRDNDRAGFNAHIDREALSRQVENRLYRELPDDPVVRGLGALLAQPVARSATNLVAQPKVFRAYAIYNGYDPAKPIPRSTLIAQVIRSAGNGRACIGDAKDPCTLVFTRQDGVWRLTEFDGDLKQLRLS